MNSPRPQESGSAFPGEALGNRGDEHPWRTRTQGLRRLAFAIVGDEAEAEDIVQGAWLETLQGSKQQASLGWMRRLVRFRALDSLRRKRQRRQVSLHGEDGTSVLEPAATDLRGQLAAQRAVLAAVETLSEPYLSTILLRYFEGLTPSEIATRQGTPVRTVKTRLTRAHAQLRDRLAAEHRDGLGHWSAALLGFAGGPPGSTHLTVHSTGYSTGHSTVPSTAAAWVAAPLGGILMKQIVLSVLALGLLLWIPFALQSDSQTPTGVEGTLGAQGPASETEPTESTGQIETKGRKVAGQGPVKPSAPTEVQAPAKDASSTATGSLGIVARWSDGTPAERLKLTVAFPGRAHRDRIQYTGPSGQVTFASLPAGTVLVSSSRGFRSEVPIEAGRQGTLEIETKPGVTMVGRVLTPGGPPVPRAEVFLADSAGGDRQPEPSAIAGMDGTYALRDVPRHYFVSARAGGWAPTLQTEVSGEHGETVTIDLTLRPGSGSIRGLVVDGQGSPLPGIRVRAWADWNSDELPASSGKVHPKRPPLAFDWLTDEEGRWASQNVGAGRLLLQVRAQGWQPWEGRVTADAGSQGEIVVQLEPGFELHGVVRDEVGQPLQGVRIFSGRPTDHDYFRTDSDSRGEFRLQDLPPGPLALKAWRKGFEEASSTIVVVPGEPQSWSPVLKQLGKASGRLLGPEGQPLERWIVAVEGGRGLWRTSAWTDADGNFEMVGIPLGARDLIVTTEDFMESAVRWMVPDALPASGPLELVVPESVWPRSSVALQVLVDGQPAPAGTRLRLKTNLAFHHREVYPDAMGRFRIDRLASQDYGLELALEGYALRHQRFHLGVGEDLDLGTWTLERGGRVEIATEGALGGLSGEAQLLGPDGMPTHRWKLEGGGGTSGLLPPGPAWVRLTGEGVARMVWETHVRNGETTELRIVAQAGKTRGVTLQRANGLPLRPRTKVHVLNGRGQILWATRDISQGQASVDRTEIGPSAWRPGEYSVVVQDPSGIRQELRWSVSEQAGPADPKPLQVDW